MTHECKVCRKNFETNGALEQHNHSRHSLSQAKKSESRSLKKHFLIGAVIIAIAIFIFTLYIRAGKPGQFDDFAKCLTEKGAVIYGNDFCQYTTKQLNMFGKSDKYLNYVKCVENKDLCDSKGVKITPTWEINGKVYEGAQEFERLSELSGCEI